MSDICERLHTYCRSLPRHRFPFEQLPLNGVYVLFEERELGHGGDRIVRVGSHTGQDNMPSRLLEHFVNPNKDRSIFRKNIGRCLLNRASDPYLAVWDQCMTKREDREQHGHLVDTEKQAGVERQVTAYIQRALSFVVIEAPSQAERGALERRMIATVANCPTCRPTAHWLGLWSPLDKIRHSGLWQVQGLAGTSLSDSELHALEARQANRDAYSG